MFKTYFQRGDSAENAFSDMSKEAEVKYDFEPWDGTPGDSYDKYEKRLLNHGSKTDDRGWSLSDHLMGVDEGGPAGPAIPGGAAGVSMQGEEWSGRAACR